MVSFQRRSLVSPWVIGVYLGLFAIIAAVALFSESPLDREGGPLSFLDAFLIFVMAGLLLALGTWGEWRTPVRAGYLLGMVLALGVGIIQLVGLLDGETPLVEELDTGNTLCWLIAGFFLVWMLRACRQLRSAERFLILGFVLQSFSLVADLTDGMSIQLPDLFDWLFGAGEEISEVLFLGSYCLGFALLVNRTTAETFRWRHEGLRAYDMLDPALVIKRAHLALRWRRRGLVGQSLTALQILAAPVRFCGELAYHLARSGWRIRRGFGKGLLRQGIEAAVVGIGAGVPAASYYKFDLFMACNRKLARHFVHRGEVDTSADGREFAAGLLQQRLPLVPVLAHGSSVAQPSRRKHAALEALNGGAAARVRVLTCLDESGRPEITHAVLCMARATNTAVDDLDAAAIAAAVDIESGRVGWATDHGLGRSIGWVRCHPATDAPITGLVLPHWRETKALALAAHRACLDRTVVGWDIALLEHGVELIDASAAPDLDLIQRTHSRPLGLDRLGRLMACHIRDGLRPTT